MGKKINEIIGMILRGILAVIYPADFCCIICSEEDVEGLCRECNNKITRCKEDELCIGYYKGPLKELILKFKYHKDFNAGEVLVRLIEGKLDLVEKDYCLTFIPIGEEALRSRGFNQCKYIADEIGFRKDFKVVDTLEKVKETKIQKTLIKEERLKNLLGAFEVKNVKKVKGRKLIIIDDVVTTGATLSEAARVLKECGASEIKILTLGKSNI
ncbi:ComF family protein [Clostridium paraputrificum]|uniref:ComF family protein n=1 Tax=Clostridium paraputrificum TaxID=29363 RepID=UPI003D34A537